MNLIRYAALAVIALCLFASLSEAKLAERECEVCIKVLSEMSKDAVGKKPEQLEKDFRAKCKKLSGVENRFCYYLGGTDDAATSIVQQSLKPLSFGKPVEKVCEDLKKKDSQICALRFEAKIDLNSVDISKLKVGDLRKIIRDENLDCSDCSEKSDYVKVVQAFKDKQNAGKNKKEL